MTKQRRIGSKGFWLALGVLGLLVLAYASLQFSSNKQRRDMAAVREYINRVQPQLAADHRFKDVRLLGYSCSDVMHPYIPVTGHRPLARGLGGVRPFDSSLKASGVHLSSDGLYRPRSKASEDAMTKKGVTQSDNANEFGSLFTYPQCRRSSSIHGLTFSFDRAFQPRPDGEAVNVLKRTGPRTIGRSDLRGSQQQCVRFESFFLGGLSGPYTGAAARTVAE